MRILSASLSIRRDAAPSAPSAAGVLCAPPGRAQVFAADLSLVMADFIYRCVSVFPNKTESEQINWVTEP